MFLNRRKIFINRIQLPTKIKNLMLSRLWISKDDCPLNEELKEYHMWEGKVQLFDNLEKADCGLLDVSTKEVQDFYGVYQTGDMDVLSNVDWIDANQSVMIAGNPGEESICLDYRFSKTSPRFVATIYSEPKKIRGRWKEIAKNEDELIRKLGLEK